jgi:hypothetical protein
MEDIIIILSNEQPVAHCTGWADSYSEYVVRAKYLPGNEPCSLVEINTKFRKS